MATNNFKPFAIASGANVISQADYEALSALASGFQAGKASSAQINKAIRQSTVMAYVLAQFIADSASVDVLDNGVPATILANLKVSMTELTPGRVLNIRKFTQSGAYSKTPGTKAAIICVQGAGASGMFAIACAAGETSGGAGGGAGGYAESYLTTVPDTANVVVGSGGKGTTSSGSPGGASSFDGTIIANGGKVGSYAATPVAAGSTQQQGGGEGGDATGGNLINATGDSGGWLLLTIPGNSQSGRGGKSRNAGGGKSAGGNYSAGYAGMEGAGGSGALGGADSGATTAREGGDGGDGYVMIIELS